jgi:uncharacterized protein (TIGR03435 family)
MTKSCKSKWSVCWQLILIPGCLVALPVSHGQATGANTPGSSVTESRVAFEVATIKPFDPSKYGGPGATSYQYADGNQYPPVVRLGGSLQYFIEYAYGVKDYQILGGPSWLKSSHYDIVAKQPVPADPSAVNAMLRSLLEDRFKLAVHAEIRGGGEYSLVTAKGGIKMQLTDTKGPGEPRIGPGMQRVRGAMNTAELASQLSTRLGHPVVDHSGLSGAYNVDLTWAADDEADGPSVFTAIQEQLGLRLEPARGSTQVLVIDHAERPSAN